MEGYSIIPLDRIRSIVEWGKSPTKNLKNIFCNVVYQTPRQIRKFYSRKLEEYQNIICQQESSRDALARMKITFQINQTLGDPEDIQSRINQLDEKLETSRLRERKCKQVLLYLEEICEVRPSHSIPNRKISYNSRFRLQNTVQETKMHDK